MRLAGGYLMLEKPPIKDNGPLPLFELGIEWLAKAARPHLHGLLFVRHLSVSLPLMSLFAAAVLFLHLTVVQLRHFRAFAQGDEASCRIGEELRACVGNIQIAHSELADAVARRKGGLSLLHAEALGVESEVG